MPRPGSGKSGRKTPVRVNALGATVRVGRKAIAPVSGTKRRNKQPERDLQSACVKLLRHLKRQKRLNFAPIPNGAYVQGTKLERMVRVRRMKDDGQLEPGALDIVIALPAGRALWAEAKRPKAKGSDAGKLDPDQVHFMELLSRLGHEHFVFQTFGEFSVRLYAALGAAEIAAAEIAAAGLAAMTASSINPAGGPPVAA